MKSYLNVVLVVVSSVMVACGGGEQSEDAETSGYIGTTKAAEPTTEGDASVVIKPYYTMTVDLVNRASDERVCSFSYSYLDWNLSQVNGPQTPPQILGPNQAYGASASVPLNQAVALTAACWHPNYPDNSTIHAANSLRTAPMFGSIACHAIYSELGGTPSVSLYCQ